MTEYRLVYSARRTLGLEVAAGGEVTVRAPYGLGKGEIERFVASRRDWIEAHVEKQRERAQNRPEPTEEEREALIQRARELLPERVGYFSALMGLRPGRVTLTNAEKRFGSCSGKNNICFSWRLMRYPDSAIDYVIVHELAHIVHKNHGPEFYALIAKYLPDWKDRRNKLK